MDDRAGMKVVTLVVENDAAVAGLDVDRLFATGISARIMQLPPVVKPSSGAIISAALKS
jgi:hypothetical protein